MKNKKTILKECCGGKGGPSVGSVIKEIPGTLKTMGQNISKGVDPAGLVGKGIKGLKKIGKLGASLPGKMIDRIENSFKLQDEADRKRNEKMINENFGSIEKYKETLSPLPKKTQVMKDTIKNTK